MKLSSMLFACLVTVKLYAADGLDVTISQTNRVILSSGTWKPSANQTLKALVAIQVFLQNRTMTNDWEAGEVKKILQHSKEYRVQFIGNKISGENLIRCNFFPDNQNFEYWKKREIEVLDGGFWFWHIDYDLESDRCFNFRSNGYA